MTSHLSKHHQPASVRTFVAVELPESTRVRLASLEAIFAACAGSLKWVRPQLIHVTLHFMGTLNPEQLVEVVEAVREGARTVRPFCLTLSGLGTFPDIQRPRVLWVGLERDEGYRDLVALHGALAEALASRDFSPELRRYEPHIMLARVRDSADAERRRRVGQVVEQNANSLPVSGPFTVSHVTVMRSDLGPAGPTYTPMESIELPD